MCVDKNVGHDYYCRVVHANYGTYHPPIVAVVSCSITLWILVGGGGRISYGGSPPPGPPAGAGAAALYCTVPCTSDLLHDYHCRAHL